MTLPTHIHEVPLTFLPGLDPTTVTLTHGHSTRPEEPHKHRVNVNIHTDLAMTKEAK